MNNELLLSANRPFRATPNPMFYVGYDSIEGARQTVVRAVRRAEGPALILGGAGLGKSMLADVLANDLSERLDVVRLHASHLANRRSLLQSILFELHMPYLDMSEGELRLSILDRLEPSAETAPDGVLLLVDEAHTLPAKLLDELRLINNFSRNNQPRTRLVLIGNMRLEETFTEPLLESFNQRIAARCYLQPMNREDTFQFIRSQLSAVGVEPSRVITTDGLECVYSASEGVPRLVNQLMDHALVLSLANHQSPISASLIEESWADLQQLPAPWNSSGYEVNESPSAVEFGSLDDNADDEFDNGSSNSLGKISAELSDVGIAHESYEMQLQPEKSLNTNHPRVIAELHASVERLVADTQAVNRIDASVGQFGNIDATQQVLTQSALTPQTPPQQSNTPENSLEETNLEESCLEETRAEHCSVHDERLTFREEQFTSPNEVDRESPRGFFANRPTDEELLGLQDEQAQVDAMGMWENDPPLKLANVDLDPPTVSDRNEQNPNEPQPTARSVASESTIPTLGRDLFGADFDEEIEIAASESKRSIQEVRRTLTNGSPESVELDERQAAQAAADYVRQLRQYSDAIEQAHVGSPTVDQIIGSPSQDATSGMWQLNTSGETDAECDIARDIEDLISQLNFSAFTVEPFSVEQISLDAKPVRGAQVPPNDSIRSGPNAEIYMLHRSEPLDARQPEPESSHDDDRDILIIEEDVPISSKLNDQISTEAASVKPAPYSQLFAKLRK